MLSQKNKSKLIQDILNINLDLLEEDDLDKLNNILTRIIKMTEPIKKSLTVQWIVPKKKLIKFTEEGDKTYKLADNVLPHIDKIKSNVPVDITIQDDQITYIAIKGESIKVQEAKEPEKKEEVKVEEKKEIQKESSKVDEGGKATYTVAGWSKDGQWYLFEETAKEWFGVDISMKEIKKGDTVEITYRLGESRGKPVNFITSVKTVQTSNVPENTPNVESNKKSSYSNDSQARAKNTAIMVAKDIVVAYVNSKAGIVDTEIKVGEMLKRLTKVCYETIESL